MRLIDNDGLPIHYSKNTVNQIAELFSEKELDEFPDYPKKLKEWSLTARPVVDGRPNYLKYLPYMQRVYEDESSHVMVVFARQMGKSTLGSSVMGCETTTIPSNEVTYVTYEDLSLSTFSNEKFRPMFETPPLKPFTFNPIGEVGRVRLRNGSINNMITHAHKFKHIEGKSVNRLIFDETQYLDLDAWVAAQQTQSFTQGKMLVLGIGGYVNTTYHKWWLDTDQREWHYSNELWRDKLEFKKSGTNRLIWDDYMLDVCAGYWRAEAPQNEFQHGYHISQMLAPWIPLTKQDAIEKYGIHPKWSIEWQQEKSSSVDFARHVMAQFIEGDVKPITDSMMYKLMDRTISYKNPEEVDYSLGPLFIGIDWGGGSRTVIWVMQMIEQKMHVVHVEFVATSDLDEQAKIAKSFIELYRPKFVIVDAGGGTYQVQKLEREFAVLLRRNFYLTRPENPLPNRKQQRELRKKNMYEIDRTFSLDRIVTMITKQNMVLPGATELDRKITDSIIEQFTNIEVELVKLKSSGQEYRRYFHPVGRFDDALHACNYSFIAYDIGKGTGEIAVGQIEEATFDDGPINYGFGNY